ncbi:MAG: metallophosphoesterase family protein [Flavobacteriales bacterium]|nr:metallophosphoesterase family protein [Flavobacteriales bacterium]
MPRIGLLSDTHGWLDPRILEHFAEVDEIWHAGDIGDRAVITALERIAPVRAVRGNIDGGALRQEFPEDQRWTMEGVDVWMTHIGGRPGRYEQRVSGILSSDPPDLFVCGHSHICLVKHDAASGVLHMNPGAAGRHGFQHVRTALRFSIENGRPMGLEVIELGPRAS